MDDGTQTVLDEARDRIVHAVNPLRIILFGSHARGEARKDSDVDLLVVMPNGVKKREIAIRIYRLLRDLSVAKDIVVTSPEEIERRGQLVATVLRPALREGKVIFECG